MISSLLTRHSVVTRLCTAVAVLTGVIANASDAGAQNAQFTANNLDELRTYAAMDNVDVTLATGVYVLQGDGNNPTFLEFSGSNSNFDLSAGQILMDTRELAGYGNSQGVRPIQVTGNNNFIQGLDFSGHDFDLTTDPSARRRADRSAVYLQVTGDDNQLVDTTLVVRGSSPYGYGDVFGKGARFPESGDPVEEGGFAFLSHNKTSSFLITGGAANTIVDNLDLTSYAYGHGFFVQGGATNTTIRNSTITGELCPGNDAIAHPEYQEYAAGADGILGTSDDGGTRSGTPLPADIFVSCQEDGIRMYTSTSGLTVENTVVTDFRSGVHSTFAGGPITVDNFEAYGTENAFVLGSNTTITNSKADIVNGPAIYVQYNDDRNSSVDLEIVGEVPEGVDWAVAYVNGQNMDITLRSDLPAGFLPEDSILRLGQTWFHNWRDQLRPTGPETASPGPYTDSVFTNLTNELTVLGEAAVGNVGYSKAGVVTNGKDNQYDGLSFVLSGTRVVLTSTAGLGNNGVGIGGNFDADIFEENASVVQDGATLELEPGIRISQEKLTITGDGVDGQGALYTDGTAGTDTRFGSASGGENSAIFLDGNASIGVGVAGQQLNVGGLNGQGNFTKRGSGLLTIGKTSTFDGDMIIAEGQVSARSNVVRTNLTVDAGASISANGGLAYNTDGTAHIDGELNLNARANPENLTQRIGNLVGSGQVTFSNAGTATLEIVGDDSDGVFTGNIDNEIDIVKAGDNSQTLAGSMSHTGTTTVTAGGLYIDGTHTGGGAYSITGATLGGLGAIQANVTVSQGSVLDAGGLDVLGTLTIGGDYAQSADSTFAVDLENASAYDSLTVLGLTALAGDLQLHSLDPTQYSFGDTLTLINSADVNGIFALIEGVLVGSIDGLNAGLAVTYGPQGVTARVSILGDANTNGIVDVLGDAFPLIGNLMLNSGATWADGDFNGDGTVDVLNDAFALIGNLGASEGS